MTSWIAGGVIIKKDKNNKPKLARIRINRRWNLDSPRLEAKLDAMNFVRIIGDRKKQARHKAIKEVDLPEIPAGMIHVNKFAKKHPKLISCGDGLRKICQKGIIRSAERFKYVGEKNGRVHNGWFVDEQEAINYLSLSYGERRYIGKMLKRGVCAQEVHEHIDNVLAGFERQRAKERRCLKEPPKR